MQSVWQGALASWSIPWAATLALLLTALTYLRGWYLLRCAGSPSLPPWRMASFLSGLFAIWVALAGPMDIFNGWLLSAHMLQHMILMMVAPPLLLLGAPLIPLVRGLPVFAAREFAGPFLNWKPAQRAGRALTQPVFALVLMGVVMLGWHIPKFYELALRSETWHQVEHASFLIASLIFWWPVAEPWPSTPHWPRWAMVPYLLVADLQNTVLSATLVFADRVLYPSYNEAPRVFGLSARQDQAAAGALMWVMGSLPFLIPALVIAVQCLSRRPLVAPVQRLRKRAPAFCGVYLSILGMFGLRGRKAEAASFLLLFVAAGLAFVAAIAWSPPDSDDLDMLAAQDAGDLSVTVYGPGHDAIAGRNTFGVLVHSGTSVLTDTTVRITAALPGGPEPPVASSPAKTSNRLLQAASVNLPESGTWRMQVEERSPSQSASLRFPLQVAAARYSALRWWPYLVMPAIGILLMAAYTVRHYRPNHPRPGAAPSAIRPSPLAVSNRPPGHSR